MADFLKHFEKIAHRDVGVVLVKNLDEAAHVRALEIVRQIDKKVHARGRALRFVIFVENGDRVSDIFHADLLKRNGAGVLGILNVYHYFFLNV